ncbi:MAG: deoxyribose-phosphate aldolase [Acidimicrobiales bacterium]
MDRAAVARRVIPLVDLTTLADDDTDERVRALCERAAATGVAAVCIYPRFVAVAVEALADATTVDGSRIAVATVVNFPAGTDAVDDIVAETERAIADGADEIDLVVPFGAALAGDLDAIETTVRRIDEVCGDRHLKTILETGALADLDLIGAVARRAIAGGADFLKTSTGKIAVGATLDAARVMLEAIAENDRRVGIKLSGGVRTLDDAADYLDLIDHMMGPGWVSPATVRFGASGLLDDLLAARA